jgi:hypothetical protein
MYWTLELGPKDGPTMTTPMAATPTTIRATAAKIFKRMCATLCDGRAVVSGPESGLAHRSILGSAPDEVLNGSRLFEDPNHAQKGVLSVKWYSWDSS